ncbi:MAG: ABC transporter ATP-binding protein, partial [Clostridia bacterium]|nr:ABC transporter ATP-binding protein [Clostridia bacterium]
SAVAGGPGAMTVGALASFLAYANKYTKPFNEISGVIAELQSALACAGRIFEFTEQPEESPDGQVDRSSLDDTVKIDNMSFSYSPDKPLIENMNFTAKPGKHTAIVGPTGCGKTTLINLLMRFYDVTGGSISVGGVDIRDMTRASLRASYGMVLQDSWLRYGTVAENIALSKPDASSEEIIEAAKAAHAHGFITRLPQGYDTRLGEDGGGLSAGQKQLLCIVRVMLCKPHMLILDEATSSIDTMTEKKIQQAFDTLTEGRTAFIVAHRLSTVQNADEILVMKDGAVIERGTHATLIDKHGFYYDLYQSQFKHGKQI